MCFNIPKRYTKATIARRDITCYKIVKQVEKGTYNSVHFAFRYNTGKLYKKRNFPINTSSYPALKNAIGRFKGYPVGQGQGFHSYANRPKPYSRGSIMCILECVIPKGSYYFTDSHFFFSSALQIVRKVR